MISGDNNAGNQAKRADGTAGDAALALDVRPEEIAHRANLSQGISVASGGNMRQIGNMDIHSMLNENFLFASLIWGAVGSGYVIYGWRQKAAIPLAGGAAMTAASFFLPALPMTLASLAIIGIVYWLLRQGY